MLSLMPGCTRPAGRQATITDAHADLVLCHAQAKEAEKAGQAAQAFGLYTYAASQGYLPAKNDLAFCYMDGIGVAPDKRRAVEIFHEAATAGYTNAQFNLGHCLHHGTGIEANAVEAAHWMIQAAGGGHAGAQYFAGVYLLAGRGVSADPAEGLRLLRLSAEQAYAEAAAKLAELGGNQRYSHPAQPETPTAGVRDYPYGSAEWAWQELGLRPGASWQQVNYAHRRLMAALHPDHEGTNEEAAALNVARDVLKKLTRGS
jgi:Sel1 repeat